MPRHKRPRVRARSWRNRRLSQLGLGELDEEQDKPKISAGEKNMTVNLTNPESKEAREVRVLELVPAGLV